VARAVAREHQRAPARSPRNRIVGSGCVSKMVLHGLDLLFLYTDSRERIRAELCAALLIAAIDERILERLLQPADERGRALVVAHDRLALPLAVVHVQTVEPDMQCLALHFRHPERLANGGGRSVTLVLDPSEPFLLHRVFDDAIPY